MQSRFNERCSFEYQGLQRHYTGLDFEIEILQKNVEFNFNRKRPVP
jgi:hypothetical protein